MIAVVAGAFGSVLGIGGGLFIIPSLTLFLGIALKRAIAASIVAVIATSLGGGNVYVRRNLADIRLGLLLALATVPGGVIGALIATLAPAQFLAAVFAVVLAASAYRMIASRRVPDAPALPAGDVGASHFRGEYLESSTGEIVRYRVIHVPIGVAVSSVAGLVSGMLGVGGGIVQVPVMNLIMKVPIKVATTTSTYIIGITGMAGAFVYYNHFQRIAHDGSQSYVDPSLAVPVTIGVFLGATAGPRFLGRLSPTRLRAIFTAVLALYTVQMILRVFGIGS